jgi:putative aminopeptidase FrvX
VVGVKSTHLTRGRAAGDDPVFALDNAWVDVGASSAREVAALGIQVLSPVTRAKAVHRYGPQGSLFAAPWIAQRAACAALVSAALRASTGPGTTVIAFTARRHFANDGLQFVLNTYPSAAVLELGGTATTAMGTGPANSADTVIGRVAAAWTLPVRYARTPAETVGLADVTQLEQRIIGWLGGAR